MHDDKNPFQSNFSKFGKNVVVKSGAADPREGTFRSTAVVQAEREKNGKALITLSLTLKARAGLNLEVFSQLSKKNKIMKEYYYTKSACTFKTGKI